MRKRGMVGENFPLGEGDMSENEVKVVWENWLAARRRKAEASWDELFESIADLFRSRGAEMVSHLSPDETGELDNALKVWREEIYKEAKEQADKEAQEAQEAMAKEGAERPDVVQSLELLSESINRILQGENQNAILNEMMDGVSHFSSRAYFFIKKRETFLLFKTQGSALAKGQLSNVAIPCSLDTSLRRVFDTGLPFLGAADTFSEEKMVLTRLDTPEPATLYLLPLKIKGKTMAILLCDGANLPPFQPQALEILTNITGLSLDLLPLKKIYTTTLLDQPSQHNVAENSHHVFTASVEEPEEMSEEEQTQHRNAQRLSRVSVSDILSYKRDLLEKGRQEGNIYKYLRLEIDQAAAHFYSKVEEKIWKKKNYFELDLISHLAMGDKKLLEGFPFKSV